MNGNLDARGVQQRYTLFLIGLVAGSLGAALILAGRLPASWGALLFIPFLLGSLGYFQARERTCAALAAQGLRRIFVEGGGVTVSRFLIAGLLDRLHVTVAPIILGSGRPAFALPEAARISDGLKLSWTCHDIAPDVLFDMAVNRARPPMVCL